MKKKGTDGDAVTRRRLLGGLSAGVTLATAGCQSIMGGASGSSLEAEWETTSTRDATATVEDGALSGGQLSLSVSQCNRARAIGDLGTVNGTLGIEFDYETRTDGYWEHPVFQVIAGGETVYDVNNDGTNSIEVGQATLQTGSVATTVTVDGSTSVVFAIRESSHCANSDHGETSFSVSNLTIEHASV